MEGIRAQALSMTTELLGRVERSYGGGTISSRIRASNASVEVQGDGDRRNY